MKGKGMLENVAEEESSSDSSTDSETDIDNVLSDVEKDLQGGNISEVKKKLKKYKHKIPKDYFNKIMKSIQE